MRLADRFKRLLGCLALGWTVECRPVVAHAAVPLTWEQLEPGLELGTAVVSPPPTGDDSRIRILRIDPARFEMQLLNASGAADGSSRTARGWAQANGLVAAINASLYQADYRTSTSLMKSRRHTNNPRLSKHNAVLLFDRLDDGVPSVQIVDRTCTDLAPVQGRYGTMVQNIRMVSCTGANVWSQQPHKWSTAAIGMDDHGRVLFIHARSPLSTHDLVDMLLALPLGLRQTMYVEGGPEAQLYVRAGERELEFVGSQGSTFAAIDNTYALPIPNVVGIRRIGPPPPAAAAR
jgi:hypothetical protein